jgi:hypothetical protein
MSEALIIAAIAFGGVLVQTFVSPLWAAYLRKKDAWQIQRPSNDIVITSNHNVISPNEIDIFKAQVSFLAGTGDVLMGLVFYGMISAGKEAPAGMLPLLRCISLPSRYRFTDTISPRLASTADIVPY